MSDWYSDHSMLLEDFRHLLQDFMGSLSGNISSKKVRA